MSVLLEALKKAAEEKHKKALGNEQSLLEKHRVTPVQKETVETPQYVELNEKQDTGKETANPSLNVVEKSNPPTERPKDKPLDLEISLALEEMSSSPAKRLTEKIIKEHSSPSSNALPMYQPIDNDWRLNDIPGYQKTKRNTQNTQEAFKSAEGILNTMSFQQETPNHVKLVLSGLILMVIFLGFGYYGLIYFQNQSQQMIQELQQYQQVKAPLPKSVSAYLAEKEQSITIENSLQSSRNNVVALVAKKEAHTVPNKVSLSPTNLSSKPSSQAKKIQIPSENQKKTTFSTRKPQPYSEPNKQLKIISSIQKSEEMLGYQAYQKKDFQQAKIHYLTALHKNPKSLPALFGLGATSAKKGEINVALNFYRQALNISPYNKEAETAIAILEASLDQPGKTDKHLRFMINQSPNNAKLRAVLGHQYAKQKDWVQAQKQYFKAYQLESENPDYAFNLAISLDRLGQYALAKRYYQQALIYSQEAVGAAYVGKIKKRLLTLQQYLEYRGDH